MKRHAYFAVLSFLAVAVPVPALAQDAVAVDPSHYKVELENDQVRVVRVRYGAGEKSAMHSHGPHIAVFLTDAAVTMTTPDGKSTPMTRKRGETTWSDGGAHQPANTGEAFEVLLIELKAPATAPK